MTDTTTQGAESQLTVEQARMLATDLVRQLGGTPGDPAAVSETLLRWADLLGGYRLSVVCMAAVQLTFADCLFAGDREEWLANGGAVLDLPEQTERTSR